MSKFQVPTTVDINPLFAKQVFVSCVAIHSHMTTKVGVAINVHEVLPNLKELYESTRQIDHLPYFVYKYMGIHASQVA